MLRKLGGSRHFPRSFIKREFQDGESYSKHNLKGLTRNASRLPTYWVKTSNIAILSTPTEFYETLLKHSQTAKKRISLAALYLGTGQLEEELVRSICTNYCQKDHLKVHVVMDRNRGTRLEHSKKDTSDTSPTTKQSAATLFQSSLQSAITSTTDISNFRVGLLEMPLKSNDWFTKFILPRLPPRYNELLTTFHLKAYAFDDTLIMSGANLSNDYFTSRQDRYWVIKNKALATLYHNMIEILYDASNDMNGSKNINLNSEHSPLPFSTSIF